VTENRYHQAQFLSLKCTKICWRLAKGTGQDGRGERREEREWGRKEGESAEEENRCEACFFPVVDMSVDVVLDRVGSLC